MNVPSNSITAVSKVICSLTVASRCIREDISLRYFLLKGPLLVYVFLYPSFFLFVAICILLQYHITLSYVNRSLNSLAAEQVQQYYFRKYYLRPDNISLTKYPVWNEPNELLFFYRFLGDWHQLNLLLLLPFWTHAVLSLLSILFSNQQGLPYCLLTFSVIIFHHVSINGSPHHPAFCCSAELSSV